MLSSFCNFKGSTAITVNPLLSPPRGGLFFQALLRGGGLIERGGLKERGAYLI